LEGHAKREEEFQRSRTGQPVGTLLEIGKAYGLLPPGQFRVALPSTEPLFVRIGLYKNDKEPKDQIEQVVLRVSRTNGESFEDLGAWIWSPDETLDSLIGGPVYHVLVENEAIASVEKLAEEVAVPLLDTLTRILHAGPDEGWPGLRAACEW
jgi:hypothetical protein